jgi:hypothetical protein
MFGMLAAVGAYDFVVPDLVNEFGDGVLVANLLLSVLAAQPLLLAFWAVFGSWPFWRRWLGSLAAGVCLYAVFLAGMAAAEVPLDVRQQFAVNLLFLPMVLLSAQFPLWILRMALGRGLSHEDDPDLPEEYGIQFRTRDALTAIALIGLALGLSRIAVLLHGAQERGDGMASWLDLAIGCAAMGLWSATGLLPCVWAAFLCRFRVRASLAVLAYAFALITCVSAALGGALAVGWVEFLKPLLALHAGLLALVLLGCQKIRSWGYTLQPESFAAIPSHSARS